MKHQVETYKAHGKIEAANRYQDQINLLQDRFLHCQEKLEKFTSPQAIFENKLSRAIADLRNVERSCCVLDLGSADLSALEVIINGIANCSNSSPNRLIIDRAL